MAIDNLRVQVTRGCVASVRLCAIAVAAALLATGIVHAQAPGAQPVLTPKASARVDLTGYWVSVVSEDWRFRMITAPKGDYPNVPLNAEGRKIADAWDSVKDEAGDRCKAYGAPNLMRVPGRLHISWADDATLKIEMDAGTQTRLIRFAPISSLESTRARPPAPAPRPQRQGYSIGTWEGRGALQVTTTGLLPGYLQTNGVPYSGQTAMTEHFDVVKEANGEQWLIVDAIVEDPVYLTRSLIRSTHFRKQADASGWDPSPCLVR
jgi:hypothetical protein